MSYRHLRCERAEGVARPAIDRPEACNALDLATMPELLDVANRCSSDESARALVLSGACTTPRQDARGMPRPVRT